MGKRSQRQPKNNNKTIYVLTGAALVVIAIIAFVVARPTGQVVGGSTTPGEFDAFAECLTDQGAIFYGTEWCGFCQQQKAMFGDSIEYVDFIDCDQNRDLCMSEGIRGYPTWKIDGELHSGLQQLTRLSDLTGCSIYA